MILINLAKAGENRENFFAPDSRYDRCMIPFSAL